MADAGPQPGWYDDPEHDGMLRYWDGETWTVNRSPTPVAPPPVVPLEDSRAGLALGFAIAGYFFVPLGIVGFILGIIELRRISAGQVRADRRGLAIAAVVVGAVLIFLIVVAAAVLIAYIFAAGDPGP
jgi:hypothetical protein